VEIWCPYGNRTSVAAVKKKQFTGATKLRGMDSTLPHFKDSQEPFNGRLMDASLP